MQATAFVVFFFGEGVIQRRRGGRRSKIMEAHRRFGLEAGRQPSVTGALTTRRYSQPWNRRSQENSVATVKKYQAVYSRGQRLSTVGRGGKRRDEERKRERERWLGI